MQAQEEGGGGSWQPSPTGEGLVSPAVGAALGPADVAAPGANGGDSGVGLGLPPAPLPPPPPPPPPPQLIVDKPPGSPQAVETSTTAISLQWAPVSCTVHSAVPVAIEYNINYELQMQQVRGGSWWFLYRQQCCQQLHHPAP